MRIALCVEYDGSAYHGWQSQPHGQTVQDTLDHALAKVAGTPLRLNCAGRTDTGVHGLAQIVHFDCDVERPDQAWVRGGNAHLPPQIAVRWAQRVAPDFHARFSALSRSYIYLLYNHSVRPALLSGRAGWHHRPLDAEAMHTAAQNLLGEHDFSAFRAAECQSHTPIKTLYRADVRRQGDFILFEFRANAFLQHMVRNIVGALVHVGMARAPCATPESIAKLLASRDRRRGAPTFSPAGLYFSGVEYAPHLNIPCAERMMFPFVPD